MARKREMSLEKQKEMWDALEEVRKAFPYTVAGFLLFAQVCINTLIRGKPDLNRMQADICKFLFSGAPYRMVQAQRGQAKTTLTAIYAVFRLIHNPRLRILIFSAGGTMSQEIANFVIDIIGSLDFLWMLRADKAAGDRSSIKGYDVHWVLKGVDKSPSVKCLGIDSHSQGSRGDIIIADDIESTKNSVTAPSREKLEELTKEFESICSDGEIIYLGTPQSMESIYNNLPARGYDVRIWTGRYPNEEQQELYGDLLAPIIVQDMIKDPTLKVGGGCKGTLGQPTCVEMFNEEALCKKELSQGMPKFMLQFMLCTAMLDKDRYPLKAGHLIVCDYNSQQAPAMPVHSNNIKNRVIEWWLDKFHVFWAVANQYKYTAFDERIMFIDGAGGGKNGDETAFAVIGTIGSYFYILDIGGVEGGYEKEKLQKLVDVAKKHRVDIVLIEKNFGNGAHAAALKPLFNKDYPIEIEEVWATGQKELRIIDVIEPVLSDHRLVVSHNLLQKDYDTSVGRYSEEVGMTYRWLHQLAYITREKGCLRHDDRLDALAGAMRYVVDKKDYDTKTVIDMKSRQETIELIETWEDPVSRRTWLSGVAENHTRHSNMFSGSTVVQRGRTTASGKRMNRFG